MTNKTYKPRTGIPAYPQRPIGKTTLHVNETYPGETLERKIERIMNNKEPITDGAPEIYTERKDGVDPAHNIRTDRFELAVEAMDTVQKDKQAKRDKFHKELDDKNKELRAKNKPKDEPKPTPPASPEPGKA